MDPPAWNGCWCWPPASARPPVARAWGGEDLPIARVVAAAERAGAAVVCLPDRTAAFG